MYFTSIVLLNSLYFYKETYSLFNILTFWCEWVFCCVLFSHFSAHLTFPYFLSGGWCKHQMLKAELLLLILSEMTKKTLPELLQSSNFTSWCLGEKHHPFNILLHFQQDFVLSDYFRFLIALKALIYWANMASTEQRAI